MNGFPRTAGDVQQEPMQAFDFSFPMFSVFLRCFLFFVFFFQVFIPFNLFSPSEFLFNSRPRVLPTDARVCTRSVCECVHVFKGI